MPAHALLRPRVWGPSADKYMSHSSDSSTPTPDTVTDTECQSPSPFPFAWNTIKELGSTSYISAQLTLQAQSPVHQPAQSHVSDVSFWEPGPKASSHAILLIQTAFPFGELDSHLPAPFPADVIPHFLQTQIREHSSWDSFQAAQSWRGVEGSCPPGATTPPEPAGTLSKVKGEARK